MIATEFVVVMNEVEACLRPDKHVVPRIQADAASQFQEQMIGAGEVRAGEEITGQHALIETYALSSQAASQLQCGVFAQRWGIDGAKVIEDGTERQEALGKVSGCPPGHFATNPKVLEQQEIATDRGEYSAAYVLGKEIRSSVGR